MENRPLYLIAHEIKQDWKNVNYAAQPYLSAMSSLKDKLFRLAIIYPGYSYPQETGEYSIDKLLQIVNLAIEYFDFTFVSMTANFLHARIEISRIN